MQAVAAAGRLPGAVIERFVDRFGESPAALVRAPGRVNLIGEHTDYNDGFVLPMAIERAAWIALRPRVDDRVRVLSMDYDEEAEFGLGALAGGGTGWLEYLRGTAWALIEAGYPLRGWEGVLTGDIPIAAGLASSAALELVTAAAFAEVTGFCWDPVHMARVGQRAENAWVGVNCGIMDQMIAAGGRKAHALLIDCRTLEARAVPLPSGTQVVIMDSGTRRGLVDSEYNERRRQCEAAADFFRVRALRDVSVQDLDVHARGLDETTFHRARHVVTENARTLAAADAMQGGDAEELGRLMCDSHASLRDDFQVSSPELNVLVDIAQAQPGCYGARMTGAGFGGCAVALVQVPAVTRFLADVAAIYTKQTDLSPQLYVSAGSEGAGAVPCAAAVPAGS